jgi:dCTP diphosphatase
VSEQAAGRTTTAQTGTSMSEATRCSFWKRRRARLVTSRTQPSPVDGSIPNGMSESPDLPVQALQARLRAFAAARDWDQFHTPKNLAMALAGEAGELLELLQWLTPEQTAEIARDAYQKGRVSEELGDVLIYALRIADVLNVDIAKIQANESRYPANTVRGSAAKYYQRARQRSEERA